jgi:hypothetical protein
MNFYFGNVSQEELAVMDKDELFHHNGEYYYYCLEFGSNSGGTEEVALYDSVGRFVPIGLDSVSQLNTALAECLAISQKLEEAATVHQMLESDDVATVECGSRFNKDHNVIVYI